MAKSGIFIIICLLGLYSCSLFEKDQEKQDGRIIARVHDHYLIQSDLQDVIKPGTPPKDSIEIASNFIDNWIRQNLVVHLAEKNLSEAQKNVDRQIENYRQSLVLYLYEKELIRQKLDTTVSREEIESYYREAKDNFFQLKNNIVRLLYLKLNRETPKLDSVRYWINSNDFHSSAKLEEYCYQYAAGFYLDDANWLLLEDVMAEIPINLHQHEWVLTQKRYKEFADTSHIYLLKVKDYRVKESIAPLSYVSDDIRKIIINKRKLDFVKDLYEQVYQDALKKNYFEIY